MATLRQHQPSLFPSDVIVVGDGLEDFPTGVSTIRALQPFNFARNVNLGISLCSGEDIILMNDDARLTSHNGLELMQRASSDIGICSAAIVGEVGNPAQHPQSIGLRLEPWTLCFVCVLIRHEVIETIGLLDERFTGYGHEDTDYCKRAQMAGFRLAVYDGCIVEHVGAGSYRSQPDFQSKFDFNRRLFEEKWA